MANDFNAALLKHRSNRISNRGGPELVVDSLKDSDEPWVPLSTKALAVGMAGMYIYFKFFYEPEEREDGSVADWLHRKFTLSRRYKKRRERQKAREDRKRKEKDFLDILVKKNTKDNSGPWGQLI